MSWYSHQVAQCYVHMDVHNLTSTEGIERREGRDERDVLVRAWGRAFMRGHGAALVPGLLLLETR